MSSASRPSQRERYKRKRNDSRCETRHFLRATLPPRPIRRGVFEILSLPRELRDLIYAYTLSRTTVLADNRLVTLTARCLSPVNILLVNHQLAHEVAELATKRSILSISWNSCRDYRPFKIPRVVANCRQLSIGYAMSCCSWVHVQSTKATGGVVFSMHELNRMLGGILALMSGVQAVEIDIFVQPDETVERCEDEIMKYWPIFKQVSQLKRFSVSRCDYKRCDHDRVLCRWTFEGPRALVMEWDRKTKKLKWVEQEDGEDDDVDDDETMSEEGDRTTLVRHVRFDTQDVELGDEHYDADAEDNDILWRQYNW